MTQESAMNLDDADLSRTEKAKRDRVCDAHKSSAKGKAKGKARRFRSDKALVTKLTAKRVNGEQHIQALDNVEHEDNGELQRISSVCKRHRIAANQSFRSILST